MLKFLSVFILCVFAAGCSGIHAQSYVMNKPREDQAQSGNGGCLAGKCPEVEPLKSTRKVYVLEVTKSIPETEAKKIEQEQTVSVVPVAVPYEEEEVAYSADTIDDVETSAPPARRGISIPPIADEPVAVAQSNQTYKVEKDDTLQKISKKFYGTYGKWIQIYEVNKAKIKNPNFVKPGTELIIPAVD